MFHNSGLSLDQAPPISVVLRFFLVATIFGIAEGVWIAFTGAEAVTGNSPMALVTVHIFTLGIMLSFMLGALFQMLPVLAGVAFKKPVKLAIRTQYPMIFGTTVLLFALYYSSAFAYTIAGVLLAIAILPVAFEMLARLLMLQNHSPSSRGMGFAIYSLVFLITLGLVLIAIRSGWSGEYYDAIRVSHITFGLYGWISMLIISVSFQVIEMFYVTMPYPKKIADYLPATIAGLATVLFVVALNIGKGVSIFEISIYILLLIYSTVSLIRIYNRKRKIVDATILFWIVGLVSLSLFAMFGVLEDLGVEWAINMMKILFPTFAISIAFAMSYKIVPFLVWFHLNAQGYFKAPMMHEVISPKYAMRHLYIHLATLLSAFVSIFVDDCWILTGVLILLSFAWIGVAIYSAWHKYIATQASGERFDMGKFKI